MFLEKVMYAYLTLLLALHKKGVWGKDTVVKDSGEPSKVKIFVKVLVTISPDGIIYLKSILRNLLTSEVEIIYDVNNSWLVLGK